jgi:hypothetical protein
VFVYCVLCAKMALLAPRASLGRTFNLSNNGYVEVLSLKKLLAARGSKQAANLPPLVLSESLCNSLIILSQIFGQSWHPFVVGELQRTLQVPNPPSGQILAGIISKLLEEASLTRPGLASRFVVSRTQIVYRSADRRYVVLIVQGEGSTVRVIWQVAARTAGTSYISYQVDRNRWSPVEWQVADQCMENLELLAKVGGEVLGFLAEYKLLPENSPFQRALEAQISHSAALRESATAEAG